MVSISTMLDKFGLLSANQLNASVQLLEVWKALNVENYPLSVDRQELNKNGVSTRGDLTCRPKEIGKTILTQKTCVSDAIRLWNQAPKIIKESNSMPLKRSESAKTTLSMYALKVGKYQKWLAMTNVLLLLSSLVLLFTGIILKINYFMDKLGFISIYFQCLPISMIVLGTLLFLISAMGFLFASVESKPALFGYSVVMAVMCLFQITTIFFIMETRSIIENGNLIVNGPEAINKYYNPDDSSFMSDWDGVHQRLRCCGFDTYIDHVAHAKPNYSYPCVPESCCIEQSEEGQCSRKTDIVGECPKLTKKTGSDPWTFIYVHGCLQILRNVYQRELKTQLLIFGLFDVLVVLFEIVSCALAAAYVAQITRRQKSYYWNDSGAGTNTLRSGQPMQMSAVANSD